VTPDTLTEPTIKKRKAGPPTAPPNFDSIPAVMRDLDQWVLWKLEYRSGKLTKPPYFIAVTDEGAQLKRAKSTDSQTWSSFEKIKADFEKWGRTVDQVAGIGFVFTDGGGIIGIDVDHVRDSVTGEWSAGILDQVLSFGSYAELSQSGTGAHVIAFGDIPGDRCRRGDQEIYCKDRFFAVTGQHINGTPDDVRNADPAALDTYYRQIDATPNPIPTEKTPTPKKATVGRGSTPDTVIIEKARTAANGEKFTALFDRGNTAGYPSASEADAALCGILKFYTQDHNQIDRLFRRSALYRPDKWDTKRGSSTYGDGTIAAALNLPGPVFQEGKNKTKGTGTKTTPAAPAAVTVEEFDDAIQEEAREILKTGDPMTYMIQTFNREHVGDEDLAKCLVLSLASRLIANSKGLHVQVSGSSGKGKSDSYRVMLQQIPTEFKLEGSFSDKSLYYGDVRPRTVIFIDDQDMSDSLREIMKSSTSSFSKPITHRTVVNGKHVPLTIAERCLWWSANVDTSGDDQELNRVLSCWVDDSKEQDEAVYQAAVERELRNDPPGEPQQVTVCRAMWTQLHAAAAAPVVISLSTFVERIGFASIRNRRDVEMFFDMIRSAAMIRFFQRDRTPGEGDAIQVDATPDDFTTAASVFKAIHGESGSQGSKLTRTEKQVLEAIANAGKTEFTAKDIARMTGQTYNAINRMFAGRVKSGGTRDPGLLGTCPALTLTDRSISVRDRDDDADRSAITTISSRANWYAFDLSVYREWTRETSGGVWLNQPGEQRIHGSKRIQTDPNGLDPLKNEPANADPDLDGIYNTNFNIKNKRIQDLNNVQHVIKNANDKLDTTKENEEACVSVVQKRGSVDPLISKSDKIAPIENQSEQDAIRRIQAFGSVVDPSLACGSVVDQIDQKSTDPTLDLSQVRPGDYKKILDGPLVQPCPVCGGRVCHYTEKIASVNARGRGSQTRHICGTCHASARDREQAAVQTLPGAISITDLVRVTAGTVGRCTVCDMQTAAYHIPGTETAICESCYGKLVREQVDIR
jgi:primase-polymerase (primpol)-like protein